jgi:murein DD-endopeptidase MepM/ murein hydrolase activator NlpD
MDILKKNKSIFFLFLVMMCVTKPISANINYRFEKDTSVKIWITAEPLDEDTAENVAKYYFDNDSIFKEFWINDVLFVYEPIIYNELPDSIWIKLIDKSKEEKFQLTWYGAVNSPYGPRWGRMHHGIDFHLRTGDSVVSAFDGIVRYAEFNKGGYGNCVIVRHLNGLETLYGHLSKIDVVIDQFVKAGELLGLGGSTGRSDGPHLHFETRFKDFSFDPFKYINKESRQLNTDSFLILKSSLINYRYPSDAKNKTNVMADEKGIKDVTKKYGEGNKSKYPKPLKKKKNTTTNNSRAVYHTVKKGESISTIAKKYGLTWVKLRQLNNLPQNVILQPGKKLRVK